MKKLLISLVVAVFVCMTCTAIAAGDSIAFDATVNTVNEGGTLQTVLEREGDPAEGEVTYTTSDQRVATVDENGLVTGVKKGRATITATVKTDKKTYRAQLRLTVNRPVTAVTVDTSKLSVYTAGDEAVAPYLTARENAEENELPVLVLPVKKKLQLAATVEPRDASNRNLIFASGNEAAFTTAKNALTGVKAGEGILTISSESDPDVSVRYRVLVVQPVTKLAVTASESSVAVGGQVTVTAAVTPDNATMPGVAWSSGDERLATVDANGTVTGVKRGNGRIIATATDGSNIRANFTLKVVQKPESIELNTTEITVDTGRNLSVKASVLPRDTDNKKVTWTSSDESIATVSRDGRIYGHAVGDCTVTCTSQETESITATLTVHVQQPVKKLTFNGKEALVYIGETTQLFWNVEPADATNQTIAFSSANEKIATVDVNGVVTGVSSGTARITAVTTDGSNRKAYINVKVGKHVTGVAMVRKHAYIDVKETATAGARLEPSDALNKHMSWYSDDESIVTANGDTNEKMKLTGISYGTTTVHGVTEDGGFETSIKVTVGEFDRGITFLEKPYYDKNGNFWLTVRNDTNLVITSITAEVECFDALDPDHPKLPVNYKDGSNKVTVVWNGTLNPGEKTGKSHWKTYYFEVPYGYSMGDIEGTVTLTQFQIENDWVKVIRTFHRPSKKFGY